MNPEILYNTISKLVNDLPAITHQETELHRRITEIKSIAKVGDEELYKAQKLVLSIIQMIESKMSIDEMFVKDEEKVLFLTDIRDEYIYKVEPSIMRERILGMIMSGVSPVLIDDVDPQNRFHRWQISCKDGQDRINPDGELLQCNTFTEVMGNIPTQVKKFTGKNMKEIYAEVWILDPTEKEVPQMVKKYFSTLLKTKPDEPNELISE